MAKLLTLDEIELETTVCPSNTEEAKFSQKSSRCWSMLVVKKNIWINYLYKRHIEEFKANKNKKWKIIELKTAKGVPFYWLEGLDRVADDEAEGEV